MLDPGSPAAPTSPIRERPNLGSGTVSSTVYVGKTRGGEPEVLQRVFFPPQSVEKIGEIAVNGCGLVAVAEALRDRQGIVGKPQSDLGCSASEMAEGQVVEGSGVSGGVATRH